MRACVHVCVCASVSVCVCVCVYVCEYRSIMFNLCTDNVILIAQFDVIYVCCYPDDNQLYIKCRAYESAVSVVR